MKKALMAVMLGFFAGCAVAPIGFYESAFPSEKKWAIRGAGEISRAYDSIPSDTPNADYAPDYTSFLSLLGVDYSPIPPITIGGEVYGSFLGAGGGDLKVKATAVQGENMAGALLLQGGMNASEGDVWGSHYSYSTQHLVAGGVLSVGNPRLSLGFGPKIVFSHVKMSSDFDGNVLDYGGFVNGILRAGWIGAGAELSLLSLDRPLANARKLCPFLGVSLGVMF